MQRYYYSVIGIIAIIIHLTINYDAFKNMYTTKKANKEYRYFMQQE